MTKLKIKWNTPLRILLVLNILVFLSLIAGFIVYKSLSPVHTVELQAKFKVSQNSVWHALHNVAAYPNWKALQQVQIQDTAWNTKTWTEISNQNQVVQATVEYIKIPDTLVIRVASDDLGYSGRWQYTLQPIDSNQCELTIREDGRYHNPLAKVIVHFFLGYEGTVQQVLDDLRLYFGV